MNLFWKRLPKTNRYEQLMADRHEAYHALVRLKESRLMEEFEALSELDFKLDKKQFKHQSDYEKSPLYEKELRYRDLLEDSDIKNYLKFHKSNELDFYKQHKQVFYDEFSGRKIDDQQWVPAFRWSYNALHGCYSLAGEYQAYSEGENTDVIDGQLQILTKRKEAEGRAWTEDKGFVNKNYKYTSDVISGESHLTEVGCVVVKFKLDGTKRPLQHFVRACDDKNQRCISLFESFGLRKFKVGHAQKGKQGMFSNIIGKNLQKDFHILELNWNKEIMSWRLNGVLIHQDTTFPHMDQMHLLIGSKVNAAKCEEGKIIIDYVRISGAR